MYYILRCVGPGCTYSEKLQLLPDMLLTLKFATLLDCDRLEALVSLISLL